MQRWPSLISLLERNIATSFSHHFNEIVNYQLLKLLERCKGGTSFNWPKIAEILYFWRKKIEDDCCVMLCS
ncbi:hypothetical protein CMV_018132 [Castanea mollissima]|uniref:Uncharacterized protein n=1 Tax=Castanea mollissima TaxID=60419 RepID=A0A8J4QVX6_9ROSI|nr:hypothetical protein CMV_018132 [Castanea mollissima]